MWIPWTREREPDPEMEAWDRYLAGDASSELSSLITRLEWAHRAPEPDADFVRRLEDQMFESALEKPQTVPRLPIPLFEVPRVRLSPGVNRSWALVAAAVTLLLASLTIVALSNDRGSGSPATVPAAVLLDSTPVAADSVGETLLSVTYDPASIDSADPSTWDSHELWVARVKSQESFSIDHPFFSCCPGVVVFHVLSGEMTVSSPVPVAVVDGEGQTALHESTTDELLAAGETVLVSGKTPAEIRNTGDEELTLLYWGGFYQETAGMSAPPFTAGALTIQDIGDPLAPGSLKLTLTEFVLDPMQTLPYSLLPSEHYAGLVAEGQVRFMTGEHASVPAGEKGHPLGSSIWPVSGPVPLTLYNPDESEPTTIYLMHFEEAEPA